MPPTEARRDGRPMRGSPISFPIRQPSATPPPPLPPPTGALPALPTGAPPQSAPARKDSTEFRSSAPFVKRRSTSPPPRPSPRSSSLLSPAQLIDVQSAAGPSTSPLGIPRSAAMLQSSSAGSSLSSSMYPSTTNSRSPRTPSRHLLQSALDLAQRAVEMDKNNDVVGALEAYREAVSRLKSVMERVGVEPGQDDGRKLRKTLGKSEDEGRTLRGIVSLRAP